MFFALKKLNIFMGAVAFLISHVCGHLVEDLWCCGNLSLLFQWVRWVIIIVKLWIFLKSKCVVVVCLFLTVCNLSRSFREELPRPLPGALHQRCGHVVSVFRNASSASGDSVVCSNLHQHCLVGAGKLPVTTLSVVVWKCCVNTFSTEL